MRPLTGFTGRYFGYVRVSTEEQNLNLQMDALQAAGVPEDRIYSDKKSGLSMDRPGLERVRKVMREGDCLVVWRLDRLGRSSLGLATIVKELEDQGVHFKTLDWDIDTTQPFGKLVFTIMSAIAQLESDMISQRTKAGVPAAKARGKVFGRQHYILGYPKRLHEFTRLWANGYIHKGKAHPLLDCHLTAPEVVKAMHKAQPNAPKFKSAQSYTNWKQRGFPGFDIKSANVLRPIDFEEDSTDGA